MLKTDTLVNYIFGILFLLFTCFTGVPFLKYIKVFLVLILIVIAIIKREKINIEIIVILIIFVSHGVLNTFYGFIKDNPGALRTTTVYILWPILFVFFLGLFKKKDIVKIDKLFVTVFKIIIFICALQVFEGITGKTNIISTVFDGKANHYINLDKRYILISNPAINVIIFLLPYFISQALLNRKRKYVVISVIGLIIPFITGRRAMILIILASIFVFLFILIFLVRKVRKDLFLMVYKKIKFLFITGFVVSLIIIVNYSTQFVNIFIKNKTGSNTERSKQFVSLLEGFSGSPIFGEGAGAVASFSRSEALPWAYELFYISMLFHKGLLGFLLFFFALLWLMFNLINIFKNNQNQHGYHALSVLVALICFLIASATNPYIGKLDFMWVIFYPVALINAFKIVKTK